MLGNYPLGVILCLLMLPIVLITKGQAKIVAFSIQSGFFIFHIIAIILDKLK